jgi:hypothetical protein
LHGGPGRALVKRGKKREKEKKKKTREKEKEPVTSLK